LAKGDRAGGMLVEVNTPGNTLATTTPAQDPCTLAHKFWSMPGTCEVHTVNGARVGVVVKPGEDNRYEQWAAYRHPDGVVVFVAQSFGGDGLPPMATLPLTVAQLAELATDSDFDLT
jgi:hypothetical protein